MRVVKEAQCPSCKEIGTLRAYQGEGKTRAPVYWWRCNDCGALTEKANTVLAFILSVAWVQIDADPA